MPSSHSQNSSEPSGLLYTLCWLFGFLSAWFLSKPCAPFKNSDTSISEEDDTATERTIRDDGHSSPVRVIIDSIPPPHAPPEEQEAREQRREGRERWNTRIQFIGLIALIIY